MQNRCLNVITNRSLTSLNALPPPLLIAAMGTLKSFANLYRSEFEDRYCDEMLRSISQKYPIYGLPLADNGTDSVYGFIQFPTQGNKELAVLLDYRVMKI